MKKLEEDRVQIDKDKLIVDKNTKEANEDREDYMKLKTQAKVFNNNNNNNFLILSCCF